MLNALKLAIMVKAFRLRLQAGEDFDTIAESYRALTEEDIQAIRQALGLEG